MPIPVTIVRASNDFIYLPLHVAENHGIFEAVQLYHGPDRPSPRDEPTCDVTSKRSLVEGDCNAINEMIDLVQSNKIAFAFCDPLEIVESKIEDPKNLIVFGAVIKRPPFWIVNSKEGATKILDLKPSVNHLIFYGESLQTGHTIGKRVFDLLELKKPMAEFVSKVGEEINQLINWKATGQIGGAALTVDLIGMARAIHRRKCALVLSIAEQDGFQSFVTTAFVTHRLIWARHPDIVQIILRAVKLAILTFRASPDEICRQQSRRELFREQRKVATDETVPDEMDAPECKLVSTLLVHDNLYDVDLTISKADWEGAAKEWRWAGDRAKSVIDLYDVVVKNDFHRETTEYARKALFPDADRFFTSIEQRPTLIDSDQPVKRGDRGKVAVSALCVLIGT
jgi:hypothetical protein